MKPSFVVGGESNAELQSARAEMGESLNTVIGTAKTDVVCRVAAAVLIFQGLSVLAGWQWNIAMLRGDYAGTYVAPLTALFHVLLGTIILALKSWPERRALLWTARLIAFLICAYGVEVLWEYANGIYSTHHTWFFYHRMSAWTATPFPGRFSLPASIGFSFGAASLLASSWRRDRLATLLYIPVAVMSYVGILGYIYGLEPLYAKSMALNTAMMFAFLAVALALFHSDFGVAALLGSERAGGIVFRRLLPFVLLLLPILGWVRLSLEQNGFLKEQGGTALMTIATVIIFMTITLVTARTLERVDSERVRAMDAMQQSEKLAVAGRLASTMAHEINNPLEAIVNLTFLLRQDPNLHPQSQDYLRLMDQELIRVAAMTRRTLGFYRDTTVANLVSLNQLVRETAEVYGGLAVRRGVRLELDLDQDPLVYAVQTELRQIVLNIYVNAVEAAPMPGGVVIARTRRRTDGFGILEIEDNGPGIPPEVQARIFTPFFTTKKDTGTGIGLWISRQLAEKSRGQLEFESRRGSTIFRLRLPLEESQSAVASD